MLSQKNSSSFLEENIKQNIYRIFPNVSSIEFSAIKRPNLFSHRLGGMCKIWLDMDGVKIEKRIWLKFINKKFHAYDEMISFLTVMPPDIRKYFPQYYFYSEGLNLIAMECIDGFLLMHILCKALFFKYSIILLKDIFLELGCFLNRFQAENTIGRKNFSEFIDGTSYELKKTSVFRRGDIDKITAHISEINQYFGRKEIIITKLLNDFSPRNILIENHSNNIKMIDTEALFHPYFPRYGSRWFDFIIFVLNLKNLSRMHLNTRIILSWKESFYKGFFGDSFDAKEISAYAYVFTLQLVLGMLERPLELRYSSLRHITFIRNIKKLLIKGVGPVV